MQKTKQNQKIISNVLNQTALDLIRKLSPQKNAFIAQLSSNVLGRLELRMYECSGGETR